MTKKLHPSWINVRNITKEEYEVLRPQCMTFGDDGNIHPIEGSDDKTAKEVLKYMLKHDIISLKVNN